MRTSESIAAISPAIVKALGEIKGAEKSSENEAFKRGGKATKYADIGAVIEASREILCKADLAALQGVGEIVDGCILITTRLLHKSGEWFETCIQVPLGKTDAQGLGSATTYGRRYALMALLNMAPVDDDGNAASTGEKPQLVVNPKTGRMINPMSPNQARKDGRGERYDALRHEIPDLTAVTECVAWGLAHKPEISGWPQAWQDDIRAELSEHMGTLRRLGAQMAGADADGVLDGDDIPDFPGDR